MDNTKVNLPLADLDEAFKLIISAYAHTTQDIGKFLEFRSDIEGKGVIWSGQGYTKQLVYYSNPGRFFISENIDLARGKTISIDNIKLIDEKELGPTITKSNLREVGHLKGLIIDGGLSVSQFLVFDANTNRLGLGTDTPNSAVSIVDNDVEIVIGSPDTTRAFIGTFSGHSFDIGTNNTARISMLPDGNIIIGNTNSGYHKVSIMGLVGINTQTPDQRSALHVNGALKFNDKLHFSADQAPLMNSYTKGDICWNNNPQAGKHVGWICVQSGNPGIWNGFGRIE